MSPVSLPRHPAVAYLILVRPIHRRMKRTIDIIVGMLLLALGLYVALVGYLILVNPFFRPLTFWWSFSCAVTGSVAVLATLGLFRWRRISASIGIIAALCAGAVSYWGHPNYEGPVSCLAIAGLVYWRFLWRSTATTNVRGSNQSLEPTAGRRTERLKQRLWRMK